MLSKSFSHEGLIPSLFTCDGRDISPSFNWRSYLRGAVSLSPVVDDSGAPDSAAPKMTLVHWILYSISLGINDLEEGVHIEELANGIW